MDGLKALGIKVLEEEVHRMREAVCPECCGEGAVEIGVLHQYSTYRYVAESRRNHCEVCDGYGKVSWFTALSVAEDKFQYLEWFLDGLNNSTDSEEVRCPDCYGTDMPDTGDGHCELCDDRGFVGWFDLLHHALKLSDAEQSWQLLRKFLRHARDVARRAYAAMSGEEIKEESHVAA